MATAAPPAPPVSAPVDDLPRTADADGEMVDIIDRTTYAVLRAAPRAVVHRAAEWHRCVHVYLFALDGRMLLQRRSPAKRVAASAWDGSAAEHVVAGEEASAAAVRGVTEELGVSVKTALRGGRLVRVRGPFEVVGDYEGAGPGGGVLREREIVETWAGVWATAGPDGGDPVTSHDPVEVAEVAWVPCADIEARVAAGTVGEFTPWFAKEAAELPPSTVYKAAVAALAEGA
ncbi:hypothetical protein MMPV_003488 [Pyropia vietnamensis]